MVTAGSAGVCSRGGAWCVVTAGVCSRGGAWSLQVLLVSVQFKGRCVVTAGSAGACSRRGVWSLQVLLVFQELAVGL